MCFVKAIIENKLVDNLYVAPLTHRLINNFCGLDFHNLVVNVKIDTLKISSYIAVHL